MSEPTREQPSEAQPRGRRAWTFGRWVITTTMQAGSAPLIDRCSGRDTVRDRWFDGRCLYLAFWRLRWQRWCRRWRTNRPGLALVVARFRAERRAA